MVLCESLTSICEHYNFSEISTLICFRTNTKNSAPEMKLKWPSISANFIKPLFLVMLSTMIAIKKLHNFGERSLNIEFKMH